MIDLQAMVSIDDYAWLDEQAAPAVLYRATPQMEEQVWIPGSGWNDAEFLLDVLMGHGDTDPIDLELARRLVPPEACIEPGGSHGRDGPEPGAEPPGSGPSLFWMPRASCSRGHALSSPATNRSDSSSYPIASNASP